MSKNGASLAAMSGGQLISWLNDNRSSLQERIASLRQLAKPIRDRECSDRTIDSYRDDFKRVEQAGSVLAASGSRASFYKLRAASARVLADRIGEALNKAERIRKKHGSHAEWAACVLDDLLPLGEQLKRFTSEKWDAEAVARRDRTHKQRHKLGRLAEDWRQRIWNRTGGGKYADAVAVAAVAGLRPAELESGVVVKLMNDGRLAFVIEGAKVKAAGEGRAAQGQKARAFAVAFPAGDPMAEHLKKLAAGRPDQKLKIRVSSGRAFASAFRSASAKAFPNSSAPPSAYAFRHGFCAEAKSSGLTPEQVAQVMGHASTRSQKHYGQRQQSRGGWSVDPIGSAPTPIRTAKTTPPPSQNPAPTARREARAIGAAISLGRSPPRAPPPRL